MELLKVFMGHIKKAVGAQTNGYGGVPQWSHTEGFRRAGTFGPLLAPQEGPVEDGTCRTNHGTHLEGISSPKNGTGLAGGVRTHIGIEGPISFVRTSHRGTLSINCNVPSPGGH